MTIPRVCMMLLALAMMSPVLAGCQKPGDRMDAARQDNSTISDAARQQEIQRQMDQNRAAAESMRAGMAAQAAAQSFRH